MRIPEGPADLTRDWLSSALRDGGVTSTASVVSFEARPLAEAKGAFGQIALLTIEYDIDEPSAPRTLIAKFSSATPALRARANTVAAYEREVRFYRDLARRTPLPTPACYYSDIDVTSGLHVLLLEYLSQAKYEPGVAGLSERAQLAVSEIAGFHAAWWGKPKLEEIGWLPDGEFDPTVMRDAHERWWPDFVKKAERHLSGPIRDIGERLGEHRAAILNHLRNAQPRTVCHGDYKFDNLIFGASQRKPLAVIDWQQIHRGRGVEDVAYFLSGNLETAERRALEPGLLNAYHRSLVDGGVQGYTFEECLHDYRLSLLNRFGSLISTIAVMPFTTEQIQRTVDVRLPRNSAAILDHNAGELLV